MERSLTVTHGGISETYTFEIEDLEELFIATYVVYDERVILAPRLLWTTTPGRHKVTFQYFGQN